MHVFYPAVTTIARMPTTTHNRATFENAYPVHTRG